MRLQCLEQRIAEMESALSAVRVMVEEAKKRPDPLAALVYQARSEWRDAVGRMKKSTRQIYHIEERTWGEAKKFGYKGDIRQWKLLMESGQ